MAIKSRKSLAKVENYDLDAAPSSRSLHVNVSNALNAAAHGLTLAEKRIIMLSVAKLDSYRPAVASKPPTARITALEFAETFGIDMATAYEQLQDAGKHLYRRTVSFLESRPGQRKGPSTVTFRWVGEVIYHKGEGWIELAFWHRVVPHLLHLKEQFTSYKLAQASSMRSVYSWRLLELLTQFESTGWMQMDIEEFSHAVEATAKQQENFAQVRRKIIEPAVRELVEKDGWLIDWKPIKAGRRVKALRFEFKRNPQGVLF